MLASLVSQSGLALVRVSIGTRMGKRTKLGMLVRALKVRSLPIGTRGSNDWKQTKPQRCVKETVETG